MIADTININEYSQNKQILPFGTSNRIIHWHEYVNSMKFKKNVSFEIQYLIQLLGKGRNISTTD